MHLVLNQQVAAALIANFLPMQAGFNMAYSAILIPQLSDPKVPFHIDTDEASWIGKILKRKYDMNYKA